MSKKWFDISGDYGDIAISTRVRLGRNLKDYPFASRINLVQSSEIINKAWDALLKSPAIGKEFKRIDFLDLNPTVALSYVEKHLCSPEFARANHPRSLFVTEDEGIGIMVNEEDHIRIQVLGKGVCFDKCADAAINIDKLLEETLTFAFDEELGYLTHCPTNLGTSMRAGVMLHLPAITANGEISELINSAGILGIAVRGMYGEGSNPDGLLYQVSNQLTLGFSENELVQRLMDTVLKIISRENSLRKQILKQDKTGLEDKVWRASGMLACARRISTEEALSLLSDLRLGVSLGIINSITIEELNNLLWQLQPASLMLNEGKELNSEQRDEARAKILRNTIKI